MIQKKEKKKEKNKKRQWVNTTKNQDIFFFIHSVKNIFSPLDV